MSDPEERARLTAQVGGHAQIEALARAMLAGDRTGLDANLAAAGISAPEIRLDPPAESLDLAPHAELRRYWDAIRGTAEIPPQTLLDPLGPKLPIGNLMLLETDASGWDYVYRVYGGTIATHAYFDWTGWSTGAMSLKLKSPMGEFYRTTYALCALARRPVYTRHVSPPWLTAATWRRLIVPFANDAGQATWFLVANLPEETRILDDDSLMERDRRFGVSSKR